MSKETKTVTSCRDLIESVDPAKLAEFRCFMKELNRRERFVRFDAHGSFDDFTPQADGHGYGFQIDGKAVPYFHPNRSFHDEIIWLNRELFYEEQATLADKVLNAAIVKFYGPSRTLEIITRGTGCQYVKAADCLNPDYLEALQSNLDSSKESIFGTTELRTSLQTAARNWGRIRDGKERPMLRSDIMCWLIDQVPSYTKQYSKPTTMKESFDFLTSIRGIGNYYGYHFSSNLARCPEIGDLVSPGAKRGLLSEDDPYVVAGVGAMDSIRHLFDVKSPNKARAILQAIRQSQDEWFDFKDADGSAEDAKVVTELGYFTHFGIEISLCQWSVYRRLRCDQRKAAVRAKAPISKDVIAK